MASEDPDLANQLLLSACDPTLNFQVTSLAKPNWPRSAPTIPCMFYKDQNEKVWNDTSSKNIVLTTKVKA